MNKGLLKRILAGFIALSLTLLSVDGGCITAIAADINDKAVSHNTGLLPIEVVEIEMPAQENISSAYEIVERYYGSAWYNNEWEKYSSYYIYNLLDDDLKEAWDAMNAVCMELLLTDKDVESVIAEGNNYGYHTDMIPMPSSYSRDNAMDFFSLFTMSNPQYYFIANSILTSAIGDSWSIALRVYDNFADGTARAAATENFESKIELAVSNFTADEEEALLNQIFQYVLDNVSYDHDIIDGGTTNEEEQAAYTQSAYSALCNPNGLTVCAGYAEMTQILCNAMGIDALSVTSATHQWNKVCINDSWYNLDTTWGDQSSGAYYGYFCRNDAFCNADSDHVMETMWTEYVPACTFDTTPSNPSDLNYEWIERVFPTINSTVATPVISESLNGTEYHVTISTETTGATIYYTINGSTPDSASSKSMIYTGAFTVPKNTVVKAVAVKNENKDSVIASQEIGKTINANITIEDIDDQTYCGVAITPNVLVSADGNLLVEGTDYTVSYKNNINKGMATAEITFIGTYAGLEKATKDFNIRELNISAVLDALEVIVDDQPYTGNDVVPTVTVKINGVALTKNIDYTYDFAEGANKKEIGPSEVEITFLGNYAGSITEEFNIYMPLDLKELDENSASFADAEPEYDGEAIKLEPIIKDGDIVLVKGTHYTLDYPDTDYINVGVKRVKVTFIETSGYIGTFTCQYEIKQALLSDLVFVDENGDPFVDEDDNPITDFEYEYTGGQITLSDLYLGCGELIFGQEYDIVFEFDLNADLVHPGEALTFTATINENENYTGCIEGTLTIVPREVTTDIFSVEEIVDLIYDGEEQKPIHLVVKVNDVLLAEGTDYTLSYDGDDYINAGEKEITITFQGNYAGTASARYVIHPIELDSDNIIYVDDEGNQLLGEDEAPITTFQYTYTGNPIGTEELAEIIRIACGELFSGAGEALTFEIQFADDVNHTDANVVTGGVEFTLVLTGNYSGMTTGTLEILPIEVEGDLVVKTSHSKDIEYTGEALFPSFAVLYNGKLLVEGTDYRLVVGEGFDNINVGENIEFNIEFIGNYEGVVHKNDYVFNITPKKPDNITSEEVNIDEVSGLISKITAGTTATQFLSMLDEGISVKIQNGTTEVSGDSLIGTGMTVSIMDGDIEARVYTIVVTGDTNGDGKINIGDMMAVKSHMLEKTLLTGVYAKAADVFGNDGKINIGDFMQVKAHTLEKVVIVGQIAK